MIKKLFLLALLIVPVLATAQEQDTLLLAPNGTLFTIHRELASTHPEVETQSTAYLVLTARHADGTQSQIVPGSLAQGSHQTPALAYDADTQTLFVFWFNRTSTMASELLFASLDSNGVWSPTTSLGDPYLYRYDLRIAVTRKVADTDGSLRRNPAISVHAVWWEFDMHKGTEAAKYAMFVIENGRVVGTETLDLDSFIDYADQGTVVDDSVLKQPVLFTSPKQDNVLIVFGDIVTKRLTEVRIRPTLPPVASEGRLRVPVGRREGRFDAPAMSNASNSRIDGIYSDDDRFALYTRNSEKLDYAIMKDGTWSEPRSIALDSQITAAAAVDALRRLLDEN